MSVSITVSLVPMLIILAPVLLVPVSVISTGLAQNLFDDLDIYIDTYIDSNTSGPETLVKSRK